MSAPVETVKRFYDRLGAGDVPGLVEMMIDDIKWETMLDFGLDVHRATGKRASATYADIWTVQDNKVARSRQYIDTLAIAEAREP